MFTFEISSVVASIFVMDKTKLYNIKHTEFANMNLFIYGKKHTNRSLLIDVRQFSCDIFAEVNM